MTHVEPDAALHHALGGGSAVPRVGLEHWRAGAQRAYGRRQRSHAALEGNR
ncbi:MAG: hypothetical protein NZ473_00100 [Candidatus Kapabacteria bacterium]|nr:hypothetical protein [Candidatus Kapabacteria bacterium]MDW8224613.1 hypothetical protein [Bacteroidota bacterium]